MACPYQRFIKMSQRALGLDDDTYRDFLESVTGKRSTTKMTVKQRWRVVEELKAKGVRFESKTAKGKKDADKDDNPQSRLVRHLWLKLKGYGVLRNSSEWALLAYVERITGYKRLEWCDNARMHKLIKSLEQWLERVEGELVHEAVTGGLLPDQPDGERIEAYLKTYKPPKGKAA